MADITPFYLGVFKEITRKNPIIGKALAAQIKGWPTSSSNLKKNCNIFRLLNKEDDNIVEGLSDGCYEILINSVRIRKALLERGLMNMVYFFQLNKAIQYTYTTMGGKKQKGGMNLKQLLASLMASFLLLGLSEGINSDGRAATSESRDTSFFEEPQQVATSESRDTSLIEAPLQVATSESRDTSSFEEPQQVATSEDGSRILFKAPLQVEDSKKGYLDARVFQAEGQIKKILEDKNWHFKDNSIVIAKDVTDEQIIFLQAAMVTLNVNLASAAQQAKYMCNQIIDRAQDAGVLDNEFFVKLVLDKAESYAAAEKQLSTADTIQAFTAWGAKEYRLVQEAIVKGMAEIPPEEKEATALAIIVEAAHNEVTQQDSGVSATLIEQYGNSEVYQSLCRETPSPSFEIVIDTTDNGNKKNIVLKTHYGNDNTGNLLLAHMGTIRRIEVKLNQAGLTDIDGKALKSLKERIQMQIRLIRKSDMFKPLTTLPPGMDTIGVVLGDATVSTERFGNLVKQIGSVFPISEEDHRITAEIEGKLFELKTKTREQSIKQLGTFAAQYVNAGKEVVKEGVSVVSDIAQKLVDEVGEVGDVLAENVVKVADTVAEGVGKVSNTAVDGVGNAAGNLIKKAAEGLDTLFFPLAKVLGTMGATALIFIWLRITYLRFGNGTPSPKKAKSNTRQFRAKFGGGLRTLKRKYSKKNKNKVKKTKTKKTKKNKKSSNKK